MKLLGVIPARAGSKGVPHKNTRLLVGKSLIERAFLSASESGVLERIVLSTNDPKAFEIAARIGLEVPFGRPENLARDDTPMLQVITHAVRAMNGIGYYPDAVMILQPTSPFRTAQHIHKAVDYLKGFDSVWSVVPIPKTLCPHHVMRIREENVLDFFLPDGAKYTRRQDVPQAYARDGTIYLTRTDVITEQGSLLGTRCSPMVLSPDEVLSIDDLSDWGEAEHRLQKNA